MRADILVLPMRSSGPRQQVPEVQHCLYAQARGLANPGCRLVLPAPDKPPTPWQSLLLPTWCQGIVGAQTCSPAFLHNVPHHLRLSVVHTPAGMERLVRSLQHGTLWTCKINAQFFLLFPSRPILSQPSGRPPTLDHAPLPHPAAPG